MTTAEDVERLGASRCVNCDRPRATQHDYDTIPGGEGEHLCWADYESSCEPEDWRERALKAERERDEARAALRTVAERQREACAQYLYSMGARFAGEAAGIRATPLVTEGDK